MSDKSKIEWTDATWNPTVGCSVISPGCKNCYAMKLAGRLAAMGSPIYTGHTMAMKSGFVWNGKVAASNWGQVIKPLMWKKPRRIFVNSMSDLFHDDMPEAVIDQVFAVIAAAPHHTFQILTKRASRMREYLTAPPTMRRIINLLQDLSKSLDAGKQSRISGVSRGWDAWAAAENLKLGNSHSSWPLWPFKHLWLGVSVEDQRRADERIPDLIATPASVRFLSCEPLLGPVDLSEWLWNFVPCGNCPCPRPDVDRSGYNECCKEPELSPPLIHQVICGGESGSGARPMHPDWARGLRDDCDAASVPFFFKQWGVWLPHSQTRWDLQGAHTWRTLGKAAIEKNGEVFWRAGKKASGRDLDGRTWDQFPEGMS